jgi:hypothetical protein
VLIKLCFIKVGKKAMKRVMILVIDVGYTSIEELDEN